MALTREQEIQRIALNSCDGDTEEALHKIMEMGIAVCNAMDEGMDVHLIMPGSLERFNLEYIEYIENTNDERETSPQSIDNQIVI